MAAGKASMVSEHTSSSLDRFGRQLRLLVVDDDQLNQSIVQIMLAPQGYLLDFASNGSEALEAIKARSYDLVFLDLILPDMNGRDVCRQVRAWEAGKTHLPIVALTAYDLPGQPLELVKAGMDDYIFKPFDLRQLSRIIGIYACGDEGAPTGAPNPGQAARRPLLVLDCEGALLDFGNDEAGYRILLTDFVASLPVRLDKMVQAQAAGDLERLGRECHSLKGISAGLGALQLSGFATQLGRACGTGETAVVADILEQIKQGMTELQAQAHSFLESGVQGA